MNDFIYIKTYKAGLTKEDKPCKHWYPPKTWMTISGRKVCSSCYTEWKLGRMSKTGSIQFQSHPHR